MPKTPQAENKNDKESKNQRDAQGSYSLSQVSPVSLPISLRRILLVGGILLAALLVVSVFLPHLSERVKFFTVNALSLLVLFAIALQAYIYRRQWETMERQWLAMREQTEIMRDTLAESRDTFYVGQRAYIGVVSVRFADNAYLAVGREPIIHITIINAGNTPAWTISARAHLAIGSEAPEYLTAAEVDTIDQTHIGHVMLPKVEKELVIETHVKISHNQINKIINNEEYFYIRGRIYFTDISKAQRNFPFCVVYSPASRGFGDCASPEREGEEQHPY